jgi:hypothetical protein
MLVKQPRFAPPTPRTRDTQHTLLYMGNLPDFHSLHNLLSNASPKNWLNETSLWGIRAYSETEQGENMFEPKRSARRDKVQEATAMVKGQIKRAAGALTGN